MIRNRRPLQWGCVWVLLVLGAACASGGPAAEGPSPAEPRGPLPGENFLVYVTDADGLWRRDTRTGAESPTGWGGRVSVGRASSDGLFLAVAAQTKDSSYLDLVATESGVATRLHAASQGGQYSMQWSRDGDVLGFAYRGENGSGTGIWIADRAGSVRSIGCSASDSFLAWRSRQQVIVGDARNAYAVSTENCATLATLPKSGKSDITFSPNGRRVSFTRSARLQTTQGTVSRPELYIADYNGANATKIADPQFNPRNAVWSPDATKIAFEIQSQDYANVTHVAIHDVATGRISFDAQRQPLGMPNDARPCWSPDGQSLAFERSFERSSGAQSYRTKQSVVRAVATGRADVVYEELSSGGGDQPAYRGGGCGWIDSQHLLVGTDDGFLVVNVRDRSTYKVGDGRSVVFVRVFP